MLSIAQHRPEADRGDIHTMLSGAPFFLDRFLFRECHGADEAWVAWD